MIEATFSVSEKEYIDMQKSHWRSLRWKILRNRIWIICLSLAGIFASYQLAKQTTADFYFLLATFPSALLFVGVIRGMFTNTNLQKKFKVAAPQISDMRVQIDNGGYRLDIPGKTNAVLYWPAFTSWLESAQVIVLLRGELMYPIPKSALDATQISELRNLCSQNITSS